MQKSRLTIICLFLVAVICLPAGAIAQDFWNESLPPTSSGPKPVASTETTTLPTTEAASLPTATKEAAAATTPEATPMPTKEDVSASAESTSTEASRQPEEGLAYKGVPWGSDFVVFKSLKSFPGSLAPMSAAFVGTADDNDIAILLGAPVSNKDKNGDQRVMFEYVPRKFASVYYEPDDTYYIFYNGKFALTMSKINMRNFDLYRDTFYKKYKKLLDYSKKYEPTKKNYCQLEAGIFEKGKTSAFLIKTNLTSNKKTFASAKLVFASTDLLADIRKEVDDKLAAEKLSSGEKEKQDLQKDLNKIE